MPFAVLADGSMPGSSLWETAGLQNGSASPMPKVFLQSRPVRGVLSRLTIYIYMRDGQNSLFFFNKIMDVIGFELDLIVLQCFEFVAYL